MYFLGADAHGLGENDSVSEMYPVFLEMAKCTQPCALLLLLFFAHERYIETQNPLMLFDAGRWGAVIHLGDPLVF